MKELSITDAEVVDLEAHGFQKHQWILERLQTLGFNLARPVHYRYDTQRGRTRIFQYEYAPDLHADQKDFDSELSSDSDWDLACELLVQEEWPGATEAANAD